MIKKVMTFGEIMLRLSPPGFQRFFQARSFDIVCGGGEANVAACRAGGARVVEFTSRGDFDTVSASVGQVLIRIQEARQ